MTIINIESFIDTLSGEVGGDAQLIAIASRARTVGPRVTMPEPIVVRLTAGVVAAPVVLLPSGVDWYWLLSLSFFSGGGTVYRNVTVPDVVSVDWGALVDVDPVTMDPLPPTVLAAWTVALGEAQASAAAAAASLASMGKGAANGVASLDAAALLPEAQVPVRLTATGLSATYVAQGSTTVTPTAGAYIELGNTGSQATFHITSAIGFTGPYIVGIGNDAGSSTALLVANKAAGVGVVVHNQSTTTGAASFGMKGIQENLGSALVRLEMGAIGSAPLLQMTAGPATGAEKLIQLLDPYGIAGEVNALDGKIVWQRSIDIRDRNDGQLSTLHLFDRDGLGTALQNHHWATKQGDTYFGATGSADMWFATRTQMDGATLKIQSGGVAGSADPAAGTFATVIGVTYDSKLGFYAAAPVVQPTGTPAAATDLATVTTLANALRASLIALGLVA